jgi:hypothetical protein
MVTTQSRLRRLAARIRRTHAELHYAQRRLFELRTGVSSLPTQRHAARRVSAEELEGLLELDYPANADRV